MSRLYVKDSSLPLKRNYEGKKLTLCLKQNWCRLGPKLLCSPAESGKNQILTAENSTLTGGMGGPVKFTCCVPMSGVTGEEVVRNSGCVDVFRLRFVNF